MHVIRVGNRRAESQLLVHETQMPVGEHLGEETATAVPNQARWPAGASDERSQAAAKGR